MAHPAVVEQLYHQERDVVGWMEDMIGKRILIRARESYHLERFGISS